ncbi:MAG: hypothetical protein SVM80_11685 [Halobacteriota archaeon]|nr:hypothetical protein [Halobacteriota archaeon]
MDKRFIASLIVIIVAIASIFMISAISSPESMAEVEDETQVIEWAWIIGVIIVIVVILGLLLYFKSES